MNSVSVAVLAGGLSSRMGKNKALLEFENSTFLDRIITKMHFDYEVLICVDKKDKYSNIKSIDMVDQVVVDEHSQIGPIEGIYQALKNAKSDYVFVCATDMPFVNEKVVKYLEQFISNDYDAYVMMDEDRVHPLCAIYSKKIIDVIKSQIEASNYRLVDILKSVRTKYVNIALSCLDNKVLRNVNTKDEFFNLLKPYVFAVSGVKNSGKTFLIEKLINEFIQEGNSVAVIKHDGHDFEIDHKDTDTFRLAEAGAIGTAIFSDRQYAIMERRQISEKEVLESFAHYDVVILEGFKNSAYPKVEVVRKGNSSEIVCDKSTLICVATDIVIDALDCDVYDINDYKGIFNCLKDYFTGRCFD